jgi:hypothetical protein
MDADFINIIANILPLLFADKERLDWIERTRADVFGNHDKHLVYYPGRTDRPMLPAGATAAESLREAIDVAMARRGDAL